MVFKAKKNVVIVGPTLTNLSGSAHEKISNNHTIDTIVCPPVRGDNPLDSAWVISCTGGQPYYKYFIPPTASNQIKLGLGHFRLYRTLLVSVCSLVSRHFHIKYADVIGGGRPVVGWRS